MKGLAMTKSKKHSPIQSEEESILSQVPEDKMAAFAAGLEGLLTKRNHERMSPDKGASTSKPRVIKDYKIIPE